MNKRTQYNGVVVFAVYLSKRNGKTVFRYLCLIFVSVRKFTHDEDNKVKYKDAIQWYGPLCSVVVYKK